MLTLYKHFPCSTIDEKKEGKKWFSWQEQEDKKDRGEKMRMKMLMMRQFIE